jgi:hypothetical protein
VIPDPFNGCCSATSQHTTSSHTASPSFVPNTHLLSHGDWQNYYASSLCTTCLYIQTHACATSESGTTAWPTSASHADATRPAAAAPSPAAATPMQT